MWLDVVDEERGAEALGHVEQRATADVQHTVGADRRRVGKQPELDRLHGPPNLGGRRAHATTRNLFVSRRRVGGSSLLPETSRRKEGTTCRSLRTRSGDHDRQRRTPCGAARLHRRDARAGPASGPISPPTSPDARHLRALRSVPQPTRPLPDLTPVPPRRSALRPTQSNHHQTFKGTAMNHVHPLMADRYVNDHLDDVRRSANQSRRRREVPRPTRRRQRHQ